MSEEKYKPYTAKRWTDIPISTTVGRVDIPKEKQERDGEKFRKFLAERGYIEKSEE